MSKADSSAIEAIRRFNRFYTSRIGVLREGIHGSTCTLTEARIVYELAECNGSSAAVLHTALDLDSGYFSRVLRKLETRGYVRRTPSAEDGRVWSIELTDEGWALYETLVAAARADTARLLCGLTEGEKGRLRDLFASAEELLDGGGARNEPFILRPPRAGDFGWVVARHGALYAAEHGWDTGFEGMVAGLVSRYLADRDPAREAAWIAERRGVNVGCVFLTRSQDEGAAKLRMLLLEPEVRGLGLGRRLVETALNFARTVEYGRVTLWTYEELTAARRLYARQGFRLLSAAESAGFGHPGVEEIWDLIL